MGLSCRQHNSNTPNLRCRNCNPKRCEREQKKASIAAEAKGKLQNVQDFEFILALEVFLNN